MCILEKGGLSSPLLVVMVVIKGSLGVGITNVGASPRGLLHPWKLIGWPDSQRCSSSLDMSYILLVGGSVLI
jgi:hypothetical protein